jgi:REP element-mobilizing transposase RayT
MSPVSAIQKIKSVSAKILFILLPKLRLRYPKGYPWSRGKFAISVGNITLEKAKEYVKNQETHHAKTFHLQGILTPKQQRRGRPKGESLL